MNCGTGKRFCRDFECDYKGEHMKAKDAPTLDRSTICWSRMQRDQPLHIIDADRQE